MDARQRAKFFDSGGRKGYCQCLEGVSDGRAANGGERMEGTQKDAGMDAQARGAPYRDPSRPMAERVRDLISRMSLDEKAAVMANTTPGIPRLGVPKYDWWSEALHGVANSGHATVFPQAVGLAAMWDDAFLREIADVIGTEGRAKFNGYKGTPEEGIIFRGLTFWSPNINIFRDPRWGRGQETYGEDPFLTGRLGVAFVRGLQGQHPEYLKAAACVKHFAVHSGPESLRHVFDAVIPDADLRETYLPAFEAVCREAGVEIAMTAYNALGGIPCSIHPLLYGLLKEWGFDGHVTSDCGSVADLSRTFKRAADDAEAEALTIKAGMSLRCGAEPSGVSEAVKRGLLSEAEVDAVLFPLLRTWFRLGFFDPEDRVPFNAIPKSANEAPAHGALALRAARESIVLLKNDGLLPLKRQGLRRVAVIGPNAASVPALLGNYNGDPSHPVTVLDGIRAALEPEGIEVSFAHGVEYSTRPHDFRPVPQPWFRGEYYTNPDLSGEPAARRTERPICYGCGRKGEQPLPDGLPGSGISIRWCGEVQTTLAGRYEFIVRSRGGFRFRADGKLALDSWSPGPALMSEARESTVALELPGNACIPLVLEYVQGKGPMKIGLGWKTPPVDSKEAEALELAKRSDLVIYAGGLTAQLEGEEMDVDYDGFSGGDRLDIELPELQRRFLEKLGALGKPLVAVNMSGSAVGLSWVHQHANALIQAWYPGQAGGTALAEILTGACNPSGRLPLTFYRSSSDLPDFADYRMEGRTYKYFRGQALYPFGHGLSYTRFEYSGLAARKAADGVVVVELELRNSGQRDGDEVVQAYAVAPASARPRALQSLCGFKRVPLKAGESKRVEIALSPQALRLWDDAAKAYAVPSGVWTIRVGASSADIRAEAAVAL
jgi:beta-glucosidase